MYSILQSCLIRTDLYYTDSVLHSCTIAFGMRTVAAYIIHLPAAGRCNVSAYVELLSLVLFRFLTVFSAVRIGIISNRIE